MKRYALASLVEAAGMSEAELGRRVGLSGSSLTKARRDGLIESAADRYACRAGLVPWLVWSDWLEDLSVECAERSCSERFVPARPSHEWCSPRCYQRNYQRERARRLYEQDAEYREAEKAKSKAYRAANRRQVAVKNRTYRERTLERRREYSARYRAANLDRIREYQREYDRARRAKNKDATGNKRQHVTDELACKKQDHDRSKIEEITASTGASQGCTPTGSQVERDSVAA